MISGFVGLALKELQAFLHNRRHTALHKAVHAMSSKANIQRNKLMHLEDTLVMYGVYSAEMLEKQYTHYIADNPCMKADLQER